MLLALDPATADPTTTLLQYGLVGLIAVVLAIVVRFLFNRLDKSYADRLAAEIARRESAEQRETEARAIAADAQTYIRSELLPALERAAVATAQATSALARARRTKP